MIKTRRIKKRTAKKRTLRLIKNRWCDKCGKFTEQTYIMSDGPDTSTCRTCGYTTIY